ncbi:MAG: hypothetical protein NTX50_21615, partial [Candidatus Sumerlaeota bacterium]|nr:hypothetical protein [Candidatus Sumerlaeota bacterium]
SFENSVELPTAFTIDEGRSICNCFFDYLHGKFIIFLSQQHWPLGGVKAWALIHKRASARLLDMLQQQTSGLYFFAKAGREAALKRA